MKHRWLAVYYCLRWPLNWQSSSTSLSQCVWHAPLTESLRFPRVIVCLTFIYCFCVNRDHSIYLGRQMKIPLHVTMRRMSADLWIQCGVADLNDSLPQHIFFLNLYRHSPACKWHIIFFPLNATADSYTSDMVQYPKRYFVIYCTEVSDLKK